MECGCSERIYESCVRSKKLIFKLYLVQIQRYSDGERNAYVPAPCRTFPALHLQLVSLINEINLDILHFL